MKLQEITIPVKHTLYKKKEGYFQLLDQKIEVP